MGDSTNGIMDFFEGVFGNPVEDAATNVAEQTSNAAAEPEKMRKKIEGDTADLRKKQVIKREAMRTKQKSKQDSKGRKGTIVTDGLGDESKEDDIGSVTGTFGNGKNLLGL